MSFRFDYADTMMMKLFMSKPDKSGGSEVACDFDKALEIIKEIDILTVGAPKIIYLVGWQYCGHDDKYPAFFEVNPYLKGKNEDTAHDSLLKLISEAKKYNTTVSVHINLADAYENSPLFDDYIKNNALIKNIFGKPARIESYNGLPCYKINYKAEWISGLFKKRFDRLLETVPLEAIGTVHIDNFQCYANANPYISASEMQIYRKKIIDTFSQKKIDITTEFTYREGFLTCISYGKIVRDILPERYPIDLLGKVPAVWWADKMTGEEIMKYYPHVYGGGLLKNNKYAAALYGNIHGEELFSGENFRQEFIKQFALINVPFFYLNSKIRKNYTESKNGVIVEYTDSTVSDGVSGCIRNGSKVLKTNDFVCLPMYWLSDSYIAYSEKGGTHTLYIDSSSAEIRKVGTDSKEKVPVTDGKLEYSMNPGQLYIINT